MRGFTAGGAALTVVLTAVATAVPLTASAAEHPWVLAILAGLLVAVPAAVGLLALARNPTDRFARLLVATAFLNTSLALMTASGSLAYSTGRVMDWVLEVVFAYLVLSFPTGRLVGRWTRRTFAIYLAMAVVLWLPTALVVSSFPVPTPLVECGGSCPPNAFQLTDAQPAIIDAFIRPLREVLLVLVWLAIIAIVVVRAHRAGPLLRRTLVPLAVTLILRNVCLAVWFVVRAVSPQSTDAIDALSWFYVLSVVLVAVGFGTGLLLRRLYSAIALERFVTALPSHPSAREVGDSLRHILDDPTLRVVSRAPDTHQWLDEAGTGVGPPRMDRDGVTTIEVNGQPMAAIVHDEALAPDRDLMRAAARFALTAIDNDRLVAGLRASLRDLSQSRARTAAVADETRRRIERDLHDGAQQRLVALRIRLGAAAERLDSDGADMLRELGDDIDDTLAELRRLARGIYPAVLTDRGVPAALSAAALICPVPTTVEVAGDRRYRPEVESAVYFVCMEALQNSAKHADGATYVAVRLALAEALSFEVIDDGNGFDVRAALASAGSGLTSLHDRLSAVGGEVAIESAPGLGTRVSGSVPAGLADATVRPGLLAL